MTNKIRVRFTREEFERAIHEPRLARYERRGDNGPFMEVCVRIPEFIELEAEPVDECKHDWKNDIFNRRWCGICGALPKIEVKPLEHPKTYRITFRDLEAYEMIHRLQQQLQVPGARSFDMFFPSECVVISDVVTTPPDEVTTATKAEK